MEEKSKTPYQPKGGMCIKCSHLDKNCADKDFSKMPVIEKIEEALIVKCVDYNRANYS